MRDTKKRYPWETYYELMNDYHMEHGNIDVHIDYEINGFRLGKWLMEQRKMYKNGKIKPEQIVKLEKLNVEWDGLVIRKKKFENSWDQYFLLAKKYFDEYGNLLVQLLLIALFRSAPSSF